MPETADEVAIPERAFFKASEVCDLLKVQPYVLRSWEAEFKDLGVQRSGGGSRVYRRTDVERVLRIRHLLLVEGLTLAGVRRRLDEETEPPLEEQVVLSSASGLRGDARDRIDAVRRGLQSLLTLLDNPRLSDAGQDGAPPLDFALAPATTGGARTTKSTKRTASRAANRSRSPEGVRSS